MKYKKILLPSQCRKCNKYDTLFMAYFGKKINYRCSSCSISWERDVCDFKTDYLKTRFGKCLVILYGEWTSSELSIVESVAIQKVDKNYFELVLCKMRYFYTAWILGVKNKIYIGRNLVKLSTQMQELCKLKECI